MIFLPWWTASWTELSFQSVQSTGPLTFVGVGSNQKTVAGPAGLSRQQLPESAIRRHTKVTDR